VTFGVVSFVNAPVEEEDTATTTTLAPLPDVTAGPTSPTSVGPSSTLVGSEPEAVLVEPEGLVNVTVIPFDSAVVAPDGTSVAVFFKDGDSGCNKVAGVDLRVRGDEMLITLSVGILGEPSQCPEDPLPKVITLLLDPPVDPAIPIFDGAKT
jgi:hypothetical protein